MPGKRRPGAKPLRLAACFITLVRDRSSPHCLSTCSRVWAAMYPYVLFPSVSPPSGTYSFMKALHSFIAGSSSHCLSVGSLKYPTVLRPTDLSRPAGVNTDPTDADTLLRYCVGFQPMS